MVCGVLWYVIKKKLEDYAEQFYNKQLLFKCYIPSEQHGCAAGGDFHIVASILAGAETPANQLTAPEGLFKDIHFALVDSSHKDEIEKSLTDQYLTEYPEYENIFQVYWVKQNNGARFVQ